MSAISRISTNTPWEPIVGYSRLVRAGELVAVSGTTATDERGLIVGGGQMYVQARQALDNIRVALERAGLAMHHVIRTRMFVTDMERFAEAARAHKEFFADSPPASTIVEVRRLANPDMMIEIEADAYAGTANSQTAGGVAAATARKPGARVKPKTATNPPVKSAKKPASKKPSRRK
ncbi:MAG: RidA family protein [Candidatus Binatus sp.]|jgi:enamine deaminase RidA (YjgF/YER057c/UK114 family)|uniref:RidA family protein n=1 Tax=Candidatus Binatus sp. TaxID=2811406 RepID=UPI003C823C9F